MRRALRGERRRMIVARWRAQGGGELDASLMHNPFSPWACWPQPFDPSYPCPSCGVDIGSCNVTDSMALEIHRTVDSCTA